MPHSHTRPTRTDTSALLKSWTLVCTSRAKREPVSLGTTPLWSFTPKDLKISQLFTELETLSESTDPPSDSTTDRGNSTPACSTTAHGLCSPLTRNHLCKKSGALTLQSTSRALLSLSPENTIPLRSKKLHSFKTWESGLTNILANTTLSPTTCTLLWTKLRPKRLTSMWSPRSSRSLRWTSTPTSWSSRTSQVRHGSACLLSWSSLTSDKLTS